MASRSEKKTEPVTLAMIREWMRNVYPVGAIAEYEDEEIILVRSVAAERGTMGHPKVMAQYHKGTKFLTIET